MSEPVELPGSGADAGPASTTEPEQTPSANPEPPAESAAETAAIRPHARPPRAGELSVGWRAVTAATWIGVIVGMAAVWNASVQLGLSTWWLGARADPQPRYVQFFPFVAPVLMLLATINQVRWLPWYGLAAAGIIGAIGVGDIGSVASLAAVEIAIAAAAALVSIASLTGMYRQTERGAPVDASAS